MTHPFSRHRRWVVAALVTSLLIGAAAAKRNTSGNLVLGVAATQVLIDFPQPSLVGRQATDADLTTLNKHAELYGRMLTTETGLAAIARRMRIPRTDLSALVRLNATMPLPLRQPESEPRASQIAAARAPYRLELQSAAWRPVLRISAAAPSAAEAERLANAAVPALQDVLAGVAREQAFALADLPQLRQLGVAHGVVSNTKARPVIAALSFMVAFGIAATILLTVLWFCVRGIRLPRPRPRPAFDDWPHTNRLLPWGVAAFLTLLWLTPFDLVQLKISLPIDMKLDRVFLPPLVGLWLLAIVIGGRGRPRLRITPIHVAIGVFVTVAFLSVVVNARDLNQTAELMLALKKLPYLLGYVALFLVVSTSVRPSEVHAFMTLTIVLALIVALGIIYEYGFMTNVFRLIADRVAKGPFEFIGDSVRSDTLDSQGRRGISGPGLVGLEAVTMLTLALPIVIVRLTTARGRQRLLYATAACILTAGIFATGRKSGLVAPVAVLATLGYFRRRELLSLAPVGFVIAVAVSAASPSVVRGVIVQFTSGSSNVATTNDRVADYDAVRPDVWTHLLIGRGYGSYGESYRLLDSEILSRAIETGLIGLMAFLGLAITVVVAARKTIASRSEFAPHALVGAAGGVVFVVAAALFDVTGFPHATYIFLSIAALASTSIGWDDGADPRQRRLEEIALPTPREVPAHAHESPRPTHSLV